jgi:hypothetical protein
VGAEGAAVSGKDKVAVTGLVVVLLAGGWLVVAPFVMGFQAVGARWTTLTRVDLWFGGGLLGLGMVALAVYAIAGLREVHVRALKEEARRRTE